MNKFEAAFYNHGLIRFCSNCYRYSVRDTYGFSYSTGASPGQLRAKNPGNWRHLHSIIANLITDGLKPLWVAHSLEDKIGEQIPSPPDGHYLVVATVGYGDFAFRKIDKILPENQFACSYREEYWDGGSETADKRAFVKTGIKSWMDLTQRKENEDWYLVGIFACPNEGLDLSMAKVIHDINEKCGTKYFNGLNPKFIDSELEFYNGYKNLQRSGFESKKQVSKALSAYHVAFSKYHNANISSGANSGMITDAVAKIYRKTPLAAADRERVHDLFGKNLSWIDRLNVKLCKIY